MFTKLFLNTTDPTKTFSEIFSENAIQIVLSVFFHTFIYIKTINFANYLFNGKYFSKKVNAKLLVAFLIIMFAGYVARYYHVKEIYSAYNYNLEKTRNHLDKLYITWLFIG
jgi:hypothetical protein